MTQKNINQEHIPKSKGSPDSRVEKINFISATDCSNRHINMETTASKPRQKNSGANKTLIKSSSSSCSRSLIEHMYGLGILQHFK